MVCCAWESPTCNAAPQGPPRCGSRRDGREPFQAAEARDATGVALDPLHCSLPSTPLSPTLTPLPRHSQSGDSEAGVKRREGDDGARRHSGQWSRRRDARTRARAVFLSRPPSALSEGAPRTGHFRQHRRKRCRLASLHVCPPFHRSPGRVAHAHPLFAFTRTACQCPSLHAPSALSTTPLPPVADRDTAAPFWLTCTWPTRNVAQIVRAHRIATWPMQTHSAPAAYDPRFPPPAHWALFTGDPRLAELLNGAEAAPTSRFGACPATLTAQPCG